MPAAAVIPAPIAYIKVVAVKKLVVGPWGRADLVRLAACFTGSSCLFCRQRLRSWHLIGRNRSHRRRVTLKKLECSKQAIRSGYISMG